jgi:hypothetical protein
VQTLNHQDLQQVTRSSLVVTGHSCH